MGRHRKKSNPTGRHHTIIALSALVPGGLISAAATAGADVHGTHLAAQAAREPAVADTPAAPPVVPAEANAPVAPVAAPPPPPPPPEPALPASLAAGPLGVPAINLAAYKNAERLLAEQDPACGMPWTLLAGIGRVESTHANDGRAGPDGTLNPPLYGPVLDGSLSGNNVISDTDGGALDGIAGYDRAVGPMQFLPETWHRYGADGNGDGRADPQNLFDAALTTGRYLCDGGLDMRDLSQQTRAILRYNNSMAYVANVMAWSVGYGSGIAPSSDELPRI
ncbi:lytic murein transglycosylase [Aldersonia sp. NBC_00410]|uniref:lytic transglycosylase domain-containing protein n=1 Tax=Aldersonia sp. NBC_00410 TaxID=2975954 RepID=UPI00224E0FC9|nr:lytic murein transglycosylase [Aldersonia sp. NBC_00410]MCX5043737.1 lytic murein transglycosylase [Aldersonia sp. NBC_00410]